MLEINELTRTTITIDFADETGSPVTPDRFTYRIEEPATATVIVAEATVNPTGASHQLVVTAAWNKCVTGKDELRRVTVIAAGLAASEYNYKLKKLKGVL